MTDKPTIELRSIKLMKSLSEETPCYSAKLFVDGRHLANVANHGHGGGDMIVSAKGRTDAEVREVERRVAETFPKLDMADYGMADVPTDLDTVCHELVWEWDELNIVKRLVKTKLAFFKEAEGGGLYTVTLKQFERVGGVVGDPLERAKAHVLKGAPRAFFLNGLPDAQLLDAYRRAS